MIVNHVQLDWYIDKLRRGEPFSLTKHSDASLYCVMGKEGGDCNGCAYTPELCTGLTESVKYEGLGFYHGIQRLTDRDNGLFDQLQYMLGINREWIDTGILASQLRDGGLFPFFDALRKVKTVAAVSRFKLDELRTVLPNLDRVIAVPPSNAYTNYERIAQSIGFARTPTIYLLACGMAACAMVPKLHDLFHHHGHSFIDVGHVFDPFLGVMSRHYMTELTPARLRQNLWG